MNFIKSIFYFLIAAFLTLAGIEVYLRKAEILTTIVEVDPIIGEKFIPNKNVTLVNEGFYIGSINKYGYIGPEYAPKRTSKDGLRITLLGDSYVAGVELFDKAHFRYILEKDLEHRTGKKVEVMNFGKDGLALSGLFAYRNNFVSKFDQDLTMIFINYRDFVAKERFFIPNYELQNDSLTMVSEFKSSDKFKSYQNFSFMNQASLVFLFYKCMNLKSRAWKIIFDKFFTGDEDFAKKYEAETTQSFGFTPVSKAIIDSLAKDPKVVLVLKGAFPDSVTTYIQNTGIKTININIPLDSMTKAGSDPNYWAVSRRNGHWNHAAHMAIGNFLSQETTQILSKRFLPN